MSKENQKYQDILTRKTKRSETIKELFLKVKDLKFYSLKILFTSFFSNDDMEDVGEELRSYKDDNGNNLLLAAIMARPEEKYNQDRILIIEYLTKNETHNFLISESGFSNFSPIILAAQYGQTEIVKYLIKGGALDWHDNAIIHGHVAILLCLSSDSNSKNKKQEIINAIIDGFEDKITNKDGVKLLLGKAIEKVEELKGVHNDIFRVGLYEVSNAIDFLANNYKGEYIKKSTIDLNKKFKQDPHQTFELQEEFKIPREHLHSWLDLDKRKLQKQSMGFDSVGAASASFSSSAPESMATYSQGNSSGESGAAAASAYASQWPYYGSNSSASAASAASAATRAPNQGALTPNQIFELNDRTISMLSELQKAKEAFDNIQKNPDFEKNADNQKKALLIIDEILRLNRNIEMTADLFRRDPRFCPQDRRNSQQQQVPPSSPPVELRARLPERVENLVNDLDLSDSEDEDHLPNPGFDPEQAEAGNVLAEAENANGKPDDKGGRDS